MQKSVGGSCKEMKVTGTVLVVMDQRDVDRFVKAMTLDWQWVAREEEIERHLKGDEIIPRPGCCTVMLVAVRVTGANIQHQLRCPLTEVAAESAVLQPA